MPSREKRLRMLALKEERERAAKNEQRLEQLRTNAAKARAALAERRANGTLVVKPRRRRNADAAVPAIGSAPLAAPTAGALFAPTNGKHHASPRAHVAERIEASLDANLDTAMTSLWSLLPADIKVFVLARVAELLAMQGRRSAP